MKKAILSFVGAALVAQVLVGCGTTPSTVALKSSYQVSTESTTKSYNSQVNRTATDALYRYNDLLREWDRAYSDSEKDRIEMKMLTVLTRALEDCKSQAYGYGYSNEKIRRAAEDALYRYEELRRRWDYAYSQREKREITNDMLTLLTRAVKDIQTQSR